MSEMAGIGQWLTAADVAERWQVSTRDVQRMAAEGRLAAFRVGRRLRFSPKTVTDYERAHTMRARSGAKAG